MKNAYKECISLAKLSKDSFWMDIQSPARCTVENVVKNILIHHLRSLSDKNEVHFCGVEWWVQVKPIIQQSNIVVDNSELIVNNQAVAIDLHYDKDETIAEYFSIGIFPVISTVTYLSDHSQLSGVTKPQSYSDVNSQAESVKIYEPQPTVIFESTASTPVGQAIEKVHISWPEVGKHIAFDGQLLHGAPAEPLLRQLNPAHEVPKSVMSSTAPANVSSDEFVSADISNPMRVTLLANIWINHQPAQVKPLSAEILGDILADSRNADTSTAINGSSSPSTYTFSEPISFEDPGPCSVMDISITAEDTTYDGYVEEFEDKDMNAKESSEAPKGLESSEGGKGNWVYLPFVGDDSMWGKEAEETALSLALWLPSKAYLSTKIKESQPASPVLATEIVKSSGFCSNVTLTYETGCNVSLVYNNDDEGEWADEVEEMTL